ncbi:hypothetical protein [Lacticaseibacillus thailandensis]|uniref:hypothetical protein n=1 Tax=Lacticaseibacillus thailandensis TaxID=381741 RepID=UPI0006CFB53D|nr:hypothetical protein [Lacticaseibacillus thailandensis]
MNLVANSNQIYEDSISNLAGSNAGGLSLENFVFVAIVFAGVYVRKFGMSFSVSMALMTAMLGQLTSGSRGGLFVQVALLVGPWILIPKGKTKGKDQSNIGVRVAVVLALAFLLIITYLRKSSLIDLPYATPNLKKSLAVFRP